MSKLDKFNKKAHRHFDQNSVDFIQLNDGTELIGNKEMTVVRIERHFTGRQIVHLLVLNEGINTKEDLARRACKIAQDAPNKYYLSVNAVYVTKYVAQPNDAEPEEVGTTWEQSIDLDIWDELQLD